MKRKVLIIVENLPVPFDKRVWKEAVALQQSAYEVTVLCPTGRGYEKRHEVIDGIHIYRHSSCREGNTHFGYLREYAWALFWEFLYTWWIYLWRGFHVIQGCNPPDNIFLIALPFKLFGVKYIFDHHDANPELYLSKYGRKGFFYRAQVWLEKLTYRFSDVVMSTNVSYRDLAVARGGLDPEDVFIVRNGPDLSFKAVAPNSALKYGKRYLIGYVGTMSIQEGLDILLDVALQIKNLGRRDIHFTCIGGGPGLLGLRKIVQDKDLEDMVTFTGRIADEQLLEILSSADICVNPDRPCEMNDISTMIKIMEYMALGKPIIQFDSKEGRFSAKEASLYASKVDQVADFANKILWLLERPEERRRMGEFGRRRVEMELSWEHSVENLLAAYNRVFSKRRRSMDLNHISGGKADQGRHTAIPAGDASAGTAQVRTDDTDRDGSLPSYVLITPARNEEAFIEKTIESMIHQTVLPVKWVIVDDGSTDATAQIAENYARRYPWIDLVRRPSRQDRNFAGKVYAFNEGIQRVQNLKFELIGNLDADISFGSDHFKFLISKFLDHPSLGVAGTAYTQKDWDSMRDSFEGEASVHGACQLFRYQCFLDIGGYRPNRAGGIDWIAVTTARMKGWETRNYPDRRFHHHRTMGTAERGSVRAMFDYGKKDYFLGGSPIWEPFRVAYRMTKKPILLGGLALLGGYCWAAVRRTERSVSRELMQFHRREQMRKLRIILTSLIKLRKVNPYLPAEPVRQVSSHVQGRSL